MLSLLPYAACSICVTTWCSLGGLLQPRLNTKQKIMVGGSAFRAKSNGNIAAINELYHREPEYAKKQLRCAIMKLYLRDMVMAAAPESINGVSHTKLTVLLWSS